MAEQQERPVGLTKGVGYQIGVRRTLPVDDEEAWQFLTSAAGVSIWLGEVENLDWAKGARYQLADGSTGEVRVFSPGSHLRVTWHPPGWPRASTIQLRVIPKGNQTVVAFHQEHLPTADARVERRAHYKTSLDTLEGIFGSD